jgi:hypothetical protein
MFGLVRVWVVQYKYDAEHYASSFGDPALSHVLTYVRATCNEEFFSEIVQK